MDNPFIALGSVLAVALLILLNWRLGGWRPARVENAEQAISRYRTDFWNDAVRGVAIDADGRAALLEITDTGPVVGLVVAHGDAFVTRRLTPGSVKSMAHRGDGTLVIRLDDLVLPRVRLQLDPAQAERWRERLAAFGSPVSGSALQRV